MSSKGFKDLKVYQMAYEVSMKIFELSKSFPPEEKFAPINTLINNQVMLRSTNIISSEIASATATAINTANNSAAAPATTTFKNV